MNHNMPGVRPPSYNAGYQQPGAQNPHGRASPGARSPPSQMAGGPPPINTGAPVSGYPPPMQLPGGAPQSMGGPPGYSGAPAGYGAPQQVQQPMQGIYGRPAAEVEGNSRSKAQLIVGIDFVRLSNSLLPSSPFCFHRTY